MRCWDERDQAQTLSTLEARDPWTLTSTKKFKGIETASWAKNKKIWKFESRGESPEGANKARDRHQAQTATVTNMDPQAVKSVAPLLGLVPIRRVRWVKRERTSTGGAAAQVLVRRLDQKCDALSATVQALFKAGTFTDIELGRVRRNIDHVETQGKRNQEQALHKDSKDPFEAFEIRSALQDDCAALRLALARAVLFGDLLPISMSDPHVRAYADLKIQEWAPLLQEWRPDDLSPEPAESVEQFVERVAREAEQGESDSMVEAHEALLEALMTLTPETPSQAWAWSAHLVIGKIRCAEVTVKDLLCKLEAVNDRLGLSGQLRRGYSRLKNWLDYDRSHLYALAQDQASACVPWDIFEFEIRTWSTRRAT